MKKTLILLLLNIIILQNVNAQLITLPETQPIEISEFNLKNPANSEKIFYGEPAEKLIQAFGSPNSSESFLFEMDQKVGSLYNFGQNRLLFQGNKLYQFTIKSNSIHVGRGTNYIKIGDPISVLDTFYPNYVIQNGSVRARIKSGSNEIDGSLIIFTDGSTITEFILHFD